MPALHNLAPTQTEAPFAATQVLALLGFAVWGTLATWRFNADGPTTTQTQLTA